MSMDEEESIDFSAIEGFDWDDANVSHIKKHNVGKSECEEVFYNEPIHIIDDFEHSSQQERRYKVLGVATRGRKLALAITLRNNRIRVIMAREQGPNEKTLFEALRPL